MYIYICIYMHIIIADLAAFLPDDYPSNHDVTSIEFVGSMQGQNLSEMEPVSAGVTRGRGLPEPAHRYVTLFVAEATYASTSTHSSFESCNKSFETWPREWQREQDRERERERDREVEKMREREWEREVERVRERETLAQTEAELAYAQATILTLQKCAEGLYYIYAYICTML
jgi:hypothetical protein